jgi:diadenosine tetraphosphate (Ap4A) HIT family hydrolase
MSGWNDPERWAKWVGGEDCPICRHVADGTDVSLAELEVSRVLMPVDGPMRGYAWMPVRRHVVELHELTEEEGAAFMRDVKRVSRAIAEATGAVKLNYEIHGNTVPHLHLHLFPRYVGDPFEGRPIDPRSITGPVYGPGEHDELTRRVAGALTLDCHSL